MPCTLQPLFRNTDPFRVAHRCAALALLCLLGGVDPAGAASSLRFPVPTRFGEFDGQTLDPEGAPLGPERLSVRRDARGRIVVEGERGISGQEMVSFTAVFEPVD